MSNLLKSFMRISRNFINGSTRRSIVRSVFIALCCGLLATASFARSEGSEGRSIGRDDEFTRRVEFLWLLDGIRNTYECEIPVTDMGTTVATCHEHEIIDLRTNKIIGTAVDATADVDVVGDGLVGTGTTTFYLPQGTLVIRGRGTIQPILEGEPVLNRGSVTHIAGIFPNAGEDNNVIDGTGVFEGAKGTFALLGALDLTNSDKGQSQFHCVYFMDLELMRRFKQKRFKH